MKTLRAQWQATELLARQLKGEQAKRAIYKLKCKSGEMLTDLKDINNCLKEFYSEIYTSKSMATQENLGRFFDSRHFPKLDTAFRENLDSDFSICELQDVIQAFPTGKAVGPDGFWPEFYKRLSWGPVTLSFKNNPRHV